MRVFLLSFILVLHQGLCWLESDDPPFSAVRHLSSSRQHSDHVTNHGDIPIRGISLETKTYRPPFSWDLATLAPSYADKYIKNKSFNESTEIYEDAKADVKKQRRKKSRNKKKKKERHYKNEDRSISSDESYVNKSVTAVSESEGNNVADVRLARRKHRNKTKKEKEMFLLDGQEYATQRKKQKTNKLKDDKLKKEKRKKYKKNKEEALRRKLEKKKKQKQEQISNNLLPNISATDIPSKFTSSHDENTPNLIPSFLSPSENNIMSVGFHKGIKENNMHTNNNNINDIQTIKNEMNEKEFITKLFPTLLNIANGKDMVILDEVTNTESNKLQTGFVLTDTDKSLIDKSKKNIVDKINNSNTINNNIIYNNDPIVTNRTKIASNITLTEYNTSNHVDNTIQKNSVIHLKTVNNGFVGIATKSPEEIGDLSCLNGIFLPAPAVNNAAIKYIRGKYLEAEYECDPDYRQEPESIAKLVCSKRRWIGESPKCLPPVDADNVLPTSQSNQINGSVCEGNRGGCDQLCNLIAGQTICFCFRGFKLQDGNCQDIDECYTSNGGCEVKCHNTPGSYHCMCPSGYRLSANGKTCLDVNECLLRNGHGPCQDSCHNLPGGYKCSCEDLKGTRLAADNHTCEDVDECARNNAGCSHTCLNTLGRVFCLCPPGFMLGTDWKTCHDIDECADPELQEGERCSIGCVNTLGSYQCVDLKDQAPEEKFEITEVPITTTFTSVSTSAVNCLPGFEVGPLGSCKDIDECDTNNGGCSHTCKNTLGSAYCLCPPSYMLANDWKTCRAMEVRSMEQLRQPSTCGPGFVSSSVGKCKDIDECSIQNGGCMQGCVNVRGSYRCICGRGFYLAGDGKSCIEERLDIVCPPLPTPSYGYLHCTRRVFMVAPENWRARWRRRIVNHAGALCELRCPHGYKVHGEYRKVCESDGIWAGPHDGYCMPFPKPKIECPHNISMETEPGQETAFVAFPQPITDVDWFRNVVSKPSWGKSLEADLAPGHWSVTFTARHPISRHTASCTLGISVSVASHLQSPSTEESLLFE